MNQEQPSTDGREDGFSWIEILLSAQQLLQHSHQGKSAALERPVWLWSQTASWTSQPLHCCFQEFFLMSVSFNVNYFISATVISLWQCFLQMCLFKKTKTGNGLSQSIWLYHARNKLFLCLFDARWTDEWNHWTEALRSDYLCKN